MARVTAMLDSNGNAVKNLFLGQTSAEVKARIEDGTYKIEELN